MVKIFKAAAKPKQSFSTQITIDQLGLDGDGVGFYEGKPVMVPGALPSEDVKVKLTGDKKRITSTTLQKIVSTSPHRVEPFCQYFDKCGGCNLQFASPEYQLELKSDALKNYLSRQLRDASPDWVAPIVATDKHYRRRAKLATQIDRQSGELHVGFRANKSKSVLSIDSCPVLAKSLTHAPGLLEAFFKQNKLGRKIGHIDLLDCDGKQYVLVREVKPFKEKERLAFIEFAEVQGWQVGLIQEEKVVDWLDQSTVMPSYLLNDYDLRIQFEATGFIQVNDAVNQAMIAQALSWLNVNPTHQVLDLFCGVGNFTLPIAKSAAKAVGIEGIPALVDQGVDNAKANGIENAEFYLADLNERVVSAAWWKQDYTHLLLDPARAGAFELVKQIRSKQFEKIVYVSCNPTSMIRDAQVLLEKGYEMTQIGVMDMFPQTAHLECMALFVRSGK